MAHAALALYCICIRAGGGHKSAFCLASALCSAYGIGGARLTFLRGACFFTVFSGEEEVRACRPSPRMAEYNFFLLESCFSVVRAARRGASFEDIQSRICAIEQSCPHVLKQAVGCLAACGAFCMFFGGTVAEAAVAALTGAAICLIGRAFPRCLPSPLAGFLCAFSGGVFGIVLCRAAALFGFDCCPSAVALGTVMPHITGLSSFRSLCMIFSGRLKGLKKLFYSLFCALAVACGYAACGVLSACDMCITPLPAGGIYGAALCSLGALGFSLMFNARLPAAIAGAAAAFGAFMLYSACLPLGAYTALFVVVFAAYALPSAVCVPFFLPAVVLLVPAAVPFVPGGALYLAAVCLARLNLSCAAEHAAVAACTLCIMAVAAVAGRCAGEGAARGISKAVRAVKFRRGRAEVTKKGRQLSSF